MGTEKLVEPKDKRTKEWKEWAKDYHPEGQKYWTDEDWQNWEESDESWHREEYKSNNKSNTSYSEWLSNYYNDTSKGLGDVVESITEATGIKQAVKWVAGEDCGCDKRKEKLNKIRFRFHPVRCFTEDQYNQWTEYIESDNYKTNKVTHHEQVSIIIPIYAQLFARQLKPMSCCIEPYIKEINQVYEQYN